MTAASRQVREFQRIRILSAMAAVACDHGVQSATVGRVIAEAGVSRKTFDELFEDRDGCLLEAIEQTVALAAQRARAAYETQLSWVDRMRAGLQALLEFFDEEPALAQLCVVQSTTAGPAALARRRELLDQLAGIVDEGRTVASREPPPLAAEGVVGGTLGVVHSRLLKPDGRALVELLGPLMSFIALPYLGSGAARRELHRPLPAARCRPSERARKPVEGLDMRLTYRTVRVLAAIAAEPGLSNSQISHRAGVTDQGQISKLLSRLARLQLIENTGQGQRKGASNAWRLTHRGEAVERAIRHERLPRRGVERR